MSVAVDKWKYKLPYKDIFGGVVALNTATFRYLMKWMSVKIYYFFIQHLGN